MTPPKIPGNCKVCGAPLTQSCMEDWVRLCQSLGHDPVQRALESKPPGILCEHCTIRNLMDEVEEGSPAAKRVLNTLKVQERWTNRNRYFK